MSADPHAGLRDRVIARVLDGDGETTSGLRRSVADNRGVPADLRQLVEKIHRQAYKVTDGDIAAAQHTYGDDQMFEIVVSSALGAARQRLMAGLKALDEA